MNPVLVRTNQTRPEGSSTNIDGFLEKIFVRLGGGGGEGVWALFVSSLQEKISNSIYGRALFEHVVYDLHKVKVNLVSIAMARLCDRGNREVPEYDFSCQNPWRLYGFFIRRFRAVKSSGVRNLCVCRHCLGYDRKHVTFPRYAFLF